MPTPNRSGDTAGAGNAWALIELVRWLAGQPGREAEVEQAWRDAAAAGDPDALIELLAGQPEREAEAERVLRDTAPTSVVRHRQLS
jgi:hypothetical protein